MEVVLGSSQFVGSLFILTFLQNFDNCLVKEFSLLALDAGSATEVPLDHGVSGHLLEVNPLGIGTVLPGGVFAGQNFGFFQQLSTHCVRHIHEVARVSQMRVRWRGWPMLSEHQLIA